MYWYIGLLVYWCIDVLVCLSPFTIHHSPFTIYHSPFPYSLINH
ncbi:MAG: hypothetical protein V9G20_27775 [Candidatus Promineifilaceae bacterium]